MLLRQLGLGAKRGAAGNRVEAYGLKVTINCEILHHCDAVQGLLQVHSGARRHSAQLRRERQRLVHRRAKLPPAGAATPECLPWHIYMVLFWDKASPRGQMQQRLCKAYTRKRCNPCVFVRRLILPQSSAQAATFALRHAPAGRTGP